MKNWATVFHDRVLRLDPKDILGLSFRAEPYEQRGLVRLFKQHVKPNELFLDVGANIGYFSLLADKLGACVIAFEPEPNMHALLNLNCNQYPIIRINEAVADYDGMADFYVDLESDGGHSMLVKGNDYRQIQVKVTKLGPLLDQSKPKIWIKVDVQGAEQKVFRGMFPQIKAVKDVTNVVIEWWPWGMENAGVDAEEFLEELYGIFKLAMIIRPEFSRSYAMPTLKTISSHLGGKGKFKFCDIMLTNDSEYCVHEWGGLQAGCCGVKV